MEETLKEQLQRSMSKKTFITYIVTTGYVNQVIQSINLLEELIK